MNLQKTILIVDDEAPIRRLSQRLLERREYLTLQAENGEEGVRLLEQNPEKVDAVLLDLNLPDGSGKDWAVRLRELRPQLPIIYFTGSNAPADRTPAGDANSYFLKKPFTPASIADVMQMALDE